MASVQNGGFLEASTPASNGSPMGVQKAVSAEHRSSRLPAPLARYRPEYPFPSCVPAELESVFPGTYESTTFQRLLPNHWTQERTPAKIHRPVPRSKDRNRTSPLPLKSKQNLLLSNDRWKCRRFLAHTSFCEFFKQCHFVLSALRIDNPRQLTSEVSWASHQHPFRLEGDRHVCGLCNR